MYPWDASSRAMPPLSFQLPRKPWLMITPGHGQPLRGTSTPPSRTTGRPSSSGRLAGIRTAISSTVPGGASACAAGAASTAAARAARKAARGMSPERLRGAELAARAVLDRVPLGQREPRHGAQRGGEEALGPEQRYERADGEQGG